MVQIHRVLMRSVFIVAAALATQSNAATFPSPTPTGSVDLTGPLSAEIGETVQWSITASVTPGMSPINAFFYTPNPAYDYVEFVGQIDFGDGTSQYFFDDSSTQVRASCSFVSDPVPSVDCTEPEIVFNFDVEKTYTTAGLFTPTVTGSFSFYEEWDGVLRQECSTIAGFYFCRLTGGDEQVSSGTVAPSAASLQVVPVPAALPLMLGGLGALALGRRRQRCAALA